MSSGLKTDLSEHTLKGVLEGVIEEALDAHLLWPEVCQQFEKLFIVSALRRCNGSIQEAAEIMGIHRNTLSKKIRDHQIDRSGLRRS
ncbi:MAG: helix-turn-helix domain-containing protein [Acidobacteriota bacterium]|jgi:DNA-binding NtrC family response regulator